MAETTGIAWCDATINWVWGCVKVNILCASCYAESWSRRWGMKLWGPGSVRRRIKSAGPLAMKLQKQAEAAETVVRVFSQSMADMFEDFDGDVVDIVKEQPVVIGKGLDFIREEAFGYIDKTPNLEWMVLTKRPQNIRKMWPMFHDRRPVFPGMPGPLGQPLACVVKEKRRLNVRLGTSPGNQETFDEMVPELVAARDLCGGLFLSCEPLLGPIKLFPVCPYCEDQAPDYETNLIECRQCDSLGAMDKDVPPLDQVIIGCESNGDKVGSLGEFKDEAAWWRGCAAIVMQCQQVGIPVFVKQGPINGYVSHNVADFPADCRVQEFPPPLEIHKTV